jgi:diadenosine tetraphosphate (Ap4A) HIT family hydrolase
LAERPALWSTGGWVVRPASNDRPGWVTVQTDAHTEGIWELDDARSASMGVALRAVTAGLIEVTGAEKVYVVSFGENNAHTHFLVIPILAGHPAEHRGPRALLQSGVQPDPAASAAIAERLRSALGEGSGEPARSTVR